ncbi:Uncharacterised protein [Mycobacteroides abscessus subsp. abscessus]|nr:Uncharacterised protein [Mycobacteroides abscessus subsp. abscessus]
MSACARGVKKSSDWSILAVTISAFCWTSSAPKLPLLRMTRSLSPSICRLRSLYCALYHWHISRSALISASVTSRRSWSYGKGNIGCQLLGEGVTIGSRCGRS